MQVHAYMLRPAIYPIKSADEFLDAIERAVATCCARDRAGTLTVTSLTILTVSYLAVPVYVLVVRVLTPTFPLVVAP